MTRRIAVVTLLMLAGVAGCSSSNSRSVRHDLDNPLVPQQIQEEIRIQRMLSSADIQRPELDSPVLEAR